MGGQPGFRTWASFDVFDTTGPPTDRCSSDKILWVYNWVGTCIGIIKSGRSRGFFIYPSHTSASINVSDPIRVLPDSFWETIFFKR